MNDRILPNQESTWPNGNLYTRVPALFRTRSPVAWWLLASCFIHGVVIILAFMIIKRTDNLRRQDFIAINLIDVSRKEEARSMQKVETPHEIKKKPLPPPKVEKTKEPKPLAKSEIVQPKPTPPPAALPKEEPVKPVETKPAVTTKSEPTLEVASTARVEGGGSEAGAGNLFGKGDVAVVPGSGTAGGGGGSATSGLGRGSGDPGLPVPTTSLKTNREAKPIQTVRAVYPPLALRMGMESDVTLRIEIDTEGKVMKAEITKSGGAGFDEEALKAVKQSRFEPAQKDGRNVPAEFTYIYRFRLQK
jgi:TonB family protein